MSGPIFWLVLLVAIVTDVLDIILNLTVIFALFTIVTGAVGSFIIFVYYFMIDVSVTDKKLITWATTLAVGAVPILNILPAHTINLLATRSFENNGILQKAASVASIKKAL